MGFITLFGGNTQAADVNDTWQYDGNAWQQVTVTGSSPSARDSAATATFVGKVLLFGGHTSAGDVNELWQWDGASWTQLAAGVNAAPSPRDSAAMATLGNSVVVFGGETSTGMLLGDTWLWNGTAWTQVDQAGTEAGAAPSPRAGAAVATLDGKVVLFGGNTATGPVGDTWTWDGTTWTQVATTGAFACEGASAATIGGSVWLFGGFTGTAQLNQLWQWNGSSWSESFFGGGPAARSGAGGAALGGGFVIFGGVGNAPINGTALLSDTWTWDGTKWTSGASGPSARDGVAMAGP